jgi:AcrR family transcriptional regulator
MSSRSTAPSRSATRRPHRSADGTLPGVATVTPNVRGVETRARILGAAVEALADGGIDEVKVARVAARAGVSTASVHYHFTTHEGLLAAAFEQSFAIAGDARTNTKYGGGTARARLRRKVEASLPLDDARRREWELWVELWLRAAREPALRETAALVYAQLHASFRALLDEGVAAGEFIVADPDGAADRLVAAVDGFGLRTLLTDPGMPPERALEQVWGRVEAELGGGAG